jgi:uncharacterized protein
MLHTTAALSDRLQQFKKIMWVDILLAFLAWICLIIGLIGSVLPLPGPPLSLLGIFLLHGSRYAEFDTGLLWVLSLATIVVSVLDYLVPMWGVKKFGGSKWGMWGSTIGLIVGLFFGPLGIFIGAFVGGLLGELAAGKDSARAMKAAFGSFIGFLFGIVLKLALCVIMIWYAVAEML